MHTPSLSDPATCQHLAQVQVCSHRGRMDDNVPAATPQNLATRMHMLCAARACCFDIDAFATADGQLLVGRPEDAEAALGKLNTSLTITQMTLAQLQTQGLSQLAFPLLTQTLAAFQNASSRLAHSSLFLPLLMIELKGSAFTEAIISSFARDAAAAKASSHLAVWFPDAALPATSDALRMHLKTANSEVRSIRGFLDRRKPTDAAGGLRPTEDASFDIFGPSLKLSDDRIAAMATAGKAIVGWTVATREELWQAAQRRVAAVITDSPLLMLQASQDLQVQRCGAKKGL